VSARASARRPRSGQWRGAPVARSSGEGQPQRDCLRGRDEGAVIGSSRGRCDWSLRTSLPQLPASYLTVSSPEPGVRRVRLPRADAVRVGGGT
jgi:hypothetical protein